MKALILAIVLATCGDVVFNQHRFTSDVVGFVSSLVRHSSSEVSGSVFRS